LLYKGENIEMSPVMYIAIAEFATIFVLAPIGFFFTAYMMQQRNIAYTRTHVQVCVLYKSVDKDYYQCDRPVDGAIIIREKKTTKDIEQESKGIKSERKGIGLLLDMGSHTGYYPPKMLKFMQVPIQEYYADGASGSIIPLVFGAIDPLEVGARILALFNQTTIKTIVRESQIKVEEQKKTQSALEGLKMLPMLAIITLLAVLGSTAFMYFTIKALPSGINTILDGLRAVGIIQ
jgi:hypothetical protein